MAYSPQSPVNKGKYIVLESRLRDREAGKGFRMQPVTADDTAIPTITRGYAKRRSTDPFVQSASNPDLLRLFSPAEHARAKGVPAHLVSGVSMTTAHEMLGQSICYPAFLAVGELVGRAFCSLVRSQAPLQLAP